MDSRKKRKIERLLSLKDKGTVAITDHIFELEDAIEDGIEESRSEIAMVRKEIGEISKSEADLADRIARNILRDIKAESKVITDDEMGIVARQAAEMIDVSAIASEAGAIAAVDYAAVAEMAASLIAPQKDIDISAVAERAAQIVGKDRLDKDALISEIMQRTLELVPPPDSAFDVRNKLEVLDGDERLDARYVKGLDDYAAVRDAAFAERQVVAANRALHQLLDVNVSGVSADQSIKWNGTQWVNYTPATGSSLTVQDIDGSPLVTNVNTIKFTNGAVTDDGAGVVTVTTGVGGGGDVSSNTATSVDSEIAVFSGTGGKTIKRATGSGIATLASGVLSATATTGSGSVVLATSPTLVTPALGTPSALVGTNITGTAAGLTAGNVTTNANLTGHVTSVGNAAVLGSFTKAQLDAAVSDGNVLYVGDVTQYTDELAQDAVGGMVDTTLVYTDLTPSLSRAALTGAITASAGSNATSLGSFTKAALDTAVSDGNVMFDGDSITNATGTAWRVFYSDGTGVITELALGASGTFLKSNGAAVAPTFATPSGSGDVSKVGTPVNNQIGVWTGDGTIEGDVDLTFDTATNTLAIGAIALDGILQTHSVKSDASDGLLIEAANGTDVGLLGVGNTANATWNGSHNFEGGQVAVGKSATTLGKLKLYGNTSGDVTIQPNAVAGTGIVLTAPATTGTIALTSDLASAKKVTIGFSATSPVTGQQGSYVVFPVAGTITGYKIVSDTGTATVKTWKIASGTAAPTIANVISTSGVSLSSGTAIISSTTSDFTTTAVAANDIFAFDLTAVSGSTKLLFELEISIT